MNRIPTHRPPTHPGEMLREEFLRPLALTQRELALRLGISYPRVNELIHKKRGVTPSTALRLEQLFGMEAQFWMNLQVAWDLYQAQRSSEAPAIRRIQRLPALRGSSSPEVGARGLTPIARGRRQSRHR